MFSCFNMIADKSMLERLMSMPLYSKRPETNSYNSDVLTKAYLELSITSKYSESFQQPIL